MNQNSATTDRIKKLRWQCRRGMLELDVIFIPFLEQFFEFLSENEQTLFEQLLKEADPDLYTWIMGYGVCPDQQLDRVIQVIRKQMKIQST